MDTLTLADAQFKAQYPVLAARLEDGSAHIEANDGTIVGIASDGIEVALGTVYSVPATETYLRDFPTPDMW